MNSKLLSIFLFLGITLPLGAHEPPLKYLLLREVHDKETQKINEKYVQALEKLKTEYMQKGDLDNAKFIHDAIEEVKTTDGTLEKDQDEPKQEAFKLDGKWKYKIQGSSSRHIRVFRDGVLIDEGGAHRKLEWSADKGTVKANWGGHYHEILKINPKSPNVIRGVNYQGRKFTYTRIK